MPPKRFILMLALSLALSGVSVAAVTGYALVNADAPLVAPPAARGATPRKSDIHALRRYLQTAFLVFQTFVVKPVRAVRLLTRAASGDLWVAD